MDQPTRDMQRAIGRFLLTRWDPVDVCDAPEDSDEYEAYIGPVYRLLAAGASDKEIAQHLVDIETKRLGFEDTNWRMLIPVAHKLRKLFTRLASGQIDTLPS